TDVIVALENSDISANSLNFRGGEVRINTSAIFGAQLRTPEELQRLLNTDVPTRLNPRQLLSSDITATGADSSLTGTIAINTPEIDPSAGLVELSENIIDATQLVISTCGKGQQQSEFIVTGRGGLPPNPIEAISDEATWLDLRPRIAGVLSGANPQTSSVADASNPILSSPKPSLVEAQGWVVNAQGKMELVAQGSEVTLQNRTVAPSACLTN
ncbi:MAG TPA: S-layer family protein, partial [Vampirovibrionales bacterium]